MILLIIGFCSCHVSTGPNDTLFAEISLKEAGIDFNNELNNTEEMNVYTFRNFYNGAGVGLGDFNNDGLTDIFFCGNQVDNKLYLNLGHFQFKDITQISGVASSNVWSTGVSIIDINSDGWLDIYICKSGDAEGLNRHNELFINQGHVDSKESIPVVSFTEQSEAYGLNNLGLSTHAAFFDYDLDGDLDCYLLNNSFRSVGNYDLRPDQREIRDEEGGNKLFRNTRIGSGNGGVRTVFEDISEEAGIYGSFIGFGLGVTCGDVNNDGWPDIYVSNDFFEKDYLYINQQDGTFKEVVEEKIAELSMGSMGADLADINNDGQSDLFVTEMLPRDERRLKTKALFENWNKYQSNIKSGYHRQFARNVLQLNAGDGEFLEIGRFAEVEATDWSWGALIFDMDNDGLKDLFVANGIYKDLLDLDYINFYSNPEEVRKVLFDENGGMDKLVEMIPSEPLINFAFQNKGNLKFEYASETWGFNAHTYSNGSAYGDLDNDGDLDLVINNVNMPPLIYENRSESLTKRHFLQVVLKDTTSANYWAIGSKIHVFTQGNHQMVELYPARGFMSSVDIRAHFGLGLNSQIDSVKIDWPDRSSSVIYNVEADTLINISKQTRRPYIQGQNNQAIPLFAQSAPFAPGFQHIENNYSDFDREALLLQMHSNEGPACCSGDVNQDGLSDFYIGGARGQHGMLFVQNLNGTFREVQITGEVKIKDSEEVDCIFFDANGDTLDDLYIASGSSEYGPNNSVLVDRLYINKSNLNFEKSSQILPSFQFVNTSAVQKLDFDSDGDTDLVVSVFIQPYLYGVPCQAYLLENDGNGHFSDVTESLAPGFKNLGMITDVGVLDIHQDGISDLVFVGEWMGVRLFQNQAGSFEELTDTGIDSLTGLWNCVYIQDIDRDGIDDIIVGNHGLNSRIRGSSSFPLRLYVNDFDANGKPEQIFTYSNSRGEYPFAQRNDLMRQLPHLSKQYPDFESFANQTVDQIFGPEYLSKSHKLEVTELRSGIIWNFGKRQFKFEAFPDQAQLTPVYAAFSEDFNNDGYNDVLIGGNQFRMKPELGINAGSFGLVLLGSDDKRFTPLNHKNSGILVKGEVREILGFQQNGVRQILIAKNDDYPKLYVNEAPIK